jgi:hypothetical protein
MSAQKNSDPGGKAAGVTFMHDYNAKGASPYNPLAPQAIATPPRERAALSTTALPRALLFLAIIIVAGIVAQEFRIAALPRPYGGSSSLPPPVPSGLLVLSWFGAVLAAALFWRSSNLRRVARHAWVDSVGVDHGKTGWTILTFRGGNTERLAVRRLAFAVILLAVLPAVFRLIDTPYEAYGLHPYQSEITDNFPWLVMIGAGLCAALAVWKTTKRMAEWEGPARMEKLWINGEWKWVRRGDPQGDPVRDDPRAANLKAEGPPEADYVPSFNHETGAYEWRQRIALSAGNPNVKAPPAPFTPRGEYGDTPDVKPQGEFI